MGATWTGAFRYEWRRLRSLRAPWVLLLLAGATNALIAASIARDVTRGSRTLTDGQTVIDLFTGGSAVAPAYSAALFAGLIGVLAGQDRRHDVARTTWLAIPRRGVVLTARAVVVMVWAMMTGVVSVGAAYAVVAGQLGRQWSPSLLSSQPVAGALVGFGVLTVLTALLGLGLAGLLRRPLAAAVLLVIVPLFAEPALVHALDQTSSGWSTKLSDHLPFTAGGRLATVGDAGRAYLFSGPGALACLVFAALVGVVLALTAALIRSRDC